MIDSMLISLAIVSGAIRFEERQDDYRMCATVFGITATLATITKKQLAQALAQTADGSAALVQLAETHLSDKQPPVAVSEPAAPAEHKRPALQLIQGGVQ